MTDMRATERLLEVIEGRIETIMRQFDRGDDTADVEAAMFTIREHALSIQTEITELRRRGDTLVRRDDLIALYDGYGDDCPEGTLDMLERIQNTIGRKP